MVDHPLVLRHAVGEATVLTLPEPSLPLVRFALVLRQGSLVDPTGKAGRARLMVELLLRGTRSKSRSAWNRELERLGSQVGATVTNELTLLHGITLKRNLAATIDLVSEALLTPALADEECEGLVRELVDSLRCERDSDDALADLFWRRALYPDHPLARRPAGEPGELSTLVAADARAAHAEQWRAGDLVAAMTGDITADEACRSVAPLIARLGSGAGPRLVLPVVPEPDGLEILVVDKPERTQVQLCLGRSAARGIDPDTNAFWLGAVAFGGTFTSKFTREVRDVRGWSYSAHVEYARKRPYPSPMVMRSAPATVDAVACLALELELYGDFARGLLEPGAVEFARSYLLNRYPLEVATASDLLLPAVRNELLGLDPNELFALPERLRAVTIEAVGTALTHHLHPTNVVAVLVATADDIVPAMAKRFPQATITVVDYLDGMPTLAANP